VAKKKKKGGKKNKAQPEVAAKGKQKGKKK
jgi:hypothetical protein